jgi:predicted acetyltransferase
VNDEQWLRLIDVKSCLAARSYNPVAASVALAVSDDRLPANAATYVVSATGAVRRKAAPQLSVDVATLGAAYLGGTSWAELAAAGRVVEHKAGAVAAADALFATRPLPWCGTFF